MRIEGTKPTSKTNQIHLQNMNTVANITLTPASLALFIAYAKDSGNWGGTPMIGGNVDSSLETNGNLTDLKAKGLVKSFKSDGIQWLKFTPLGVEFAKLHGHDLSWID